MTQSYAYYYSTSGSGFKIMQLTSEKQLASVTNSVVTEHAVSLRPFSRDVYTVH
jgi:hypothetical protein